ncbi:MAG: hypothetical protein FD167_3901 [bacterium]|nr:MAG: hypothetical protein FD167_3901 [bacterium]
MNKRFFQYFLIFGIVLTTLLIPTDITAQGRGRNDHRRYEERYTKREVAEIIRRVEESSDRFRKDLDRDLDRSRLDGSKKEDRINEDVKRFENAFDSLRREFDRSDSWWESRNNVNSALNAARPVATRLRNNRFSSNVQAQWRHLRRDLNRLASTYNLPQV